MLTINIADRQLRGNASKGLSLYDVLVATSDLDTITFTLDTGRKRFSLTGTLNASKDKISGVWTRHDTGSSQSVILTRSRIGTLTQKEHEDLWSDLFRTLSFIGG